TLHGLQPPILLLAARADVEVSLDPLHLTNAQRAIDVCGEIVGYMTGPGHSLHLRPLSSGPSAPRSICRARWSRDRTVPTGQRSASATSSYDSPSMSARTTAARNSCGSRSSAA